MEKRLYFKCEILTRWESHCSERCEDPTPSLGEMMGAQKKCPNKHNGLDTAMYLAVPKQHAGTTNMGGNPSPHDPAAPLFPSATSCARAGRGCSAGRRPREGTERMRILGRCCRLRLPRHLRGLYLQSKRSPFPTFLKIRV